VDRFERPRPVEGRLVPRAEALAQAVAERALEIVVAALDMNALLDRVDMNRVRQEQPLCPPPFSPLHRRQETGRSLAAF
jgi:hypothetical protein